MIATVEKEACQGDATAYGLALEMHKPESVVTLLLLSDVLGILGNLSHTF